MIPSLLVAELVFKFKRSLCDWLGGRFDAFPSSGEINFRVDDAGAAIDRVLSTYSADALSLDEADGVSLAFCDCRLNNLRRSNTESLVPLNIESRGGFEGLESKVADILKLCCGAVT